MPIAEPGDALWAQVSRYTAWPDTDEDAVRTMSAGWRAGGEQFDRASTFDLGAVAGGWTDRAGLDFHGRTTERLRGAAATGARMARTAAQADAFAAEVAGVKSGIHALMAANQDAYARTAAMPPDVGTAFVRQVAAMVDRMKAEAAARVSATPAGVRFARGQAPAGPPPGGDPQAVADWWNGLGDPERAYWTARPGEIGGLDGIPAEVRSQANLTLLRERIAELERLEHSPGAPALFDDRLAALRAIAARFDAGAPGSDELFLLGFDDAGDGRAVVSVGNPDTAANVATLVPGLGNDIGSVPFQIDRANTLRADPGNAVIAWLDYNPPERLTNGSLTGLSEQRAQEATGDFARFQEGLRATHVGDPSFNTVVGHSYGGTLAGLTAAGEEGLDADRLVLVAPTNPGVERVSDYRLIGADGVPVPAADVGRRVFVTVADDDQVVSAASWFTRNDARAEGFGAQYFPTPAGAADPHSGAPFEGEPLRQIRNLVDGGALY